MESLNLVPDIGLYQPSSVHGMHLENKTLKGISSLPPSLLPLSLFPSLTSFLLFLLFPCISATFLSPPHLPISNCFSNQFLFFFNFSWKLNQKTHLFWSQMVLSPCMWKLFKKFMETYIMKRLYAFFFTVVTRMPYLNALDFSDVLIKGLIQNH